MSEALPLPEAVQTRAGLRACSDALCDRLIGILAARLTFVDRVAVLKAREGIAAAAPSRMQAVVDRVRTRAEVTGFVPDIAGAMARVMIEQRIAREARVSGQNGRDA
ncbi:chorismate mutase [Pararhodobacter zhoushanensis]|uniref:chorismate mutase n=1 Tax=Pararhodobacter zhoushanensis TaxID=2479545 RepID=A0ABT3H4I3_9RHOB|nr:chorismate mutase [Pararhodobacter zhoushanensis]MCW1934660.1 chorismate mutase [Pararhodobacter zhoushanensis]